MPSEDAPEVRRELNRLCGRSEAGRVFAEQQAAEQPEHRDQAVTGDVAILDQPPGVPAVWGRGDEVLWACGEPFLLVSPPGVGKTTLLAARCR